LNANAQFSGKITQLRRMLYWIRSQLIIAGLDESSVHKVEIASEEALVNIIRHAYKNQTGTIEINVYEGEPFVEIVIRDHGPPFNPLDRDVSFDRSAGIDEREIGGLGILFIREYMDEVRYQREKDANVLILIKKR
jgi:anti-sigma regulatory factor (Ser/Thr protein kinase)